jgi:hypothetical protein
MSLAHKYLLPTLSISCFLLIPLTATGASLCVDAKGSNGCNKTISEAVTAASAGDTINVAPGTYKEDVVIGKPLSLIGAGRNNTIIDALGLSNGIYINGFDFPGLSRVVVTGLTVMNANYEGILAQNASSVTIADNAVHDNDRNLVISADTCTGLATAAPFETNEGDDCGEGIHLMGVDHSVVAGNFVHHNAGGILISDETAANHDNVITRNTVQDNAYDCGITLASHGAYAKSGPTPQPFGIYHNTVSDNDSERNGLGSSGGGAGVGIFAPGPGNKNYDNSVVGNRLIGNTLPGVAIHSHAPVPPPAGPMLNDNAIVANFIAFNGPDGDVGTTVPTGISVLGAAPVNGLVIADNIVFGENIAIAVNSASVIDVRLNDLGGAKVGVSNLNSGGTVNAVENWWGCSRGPASPGCSTTSGSNIDFTPWLTAPDLLSSSQRDHRQDQH